jgi:hypothetical protein
MTLSAKALQTYQVVLYDRALHPGLFQFRGRRVVRNDAYRLEAWIMPGAHALRFEANGVCAAEVVTNQEGVLPSEGLLASLLCDGEHDHERRIGRILYMTTAETETLLDNVYLDMLDELRDHARECRALRHEWLSGSGPCLSMIDVQRYRREVHIQGYHLLADEGLVLRTQSLFEHV